MNLLTISLENFDFREVRETEVESGLISESEHIAWIHLLKNLIVNQ